MILPDVNLLLYAVDTSSTRHARARTWLEDLLNGSETVALAWGALLGFVRLSTGPTVMSAPFPVDEALAVTDGWLARRNVVVVHPTDRHPAILRDLLTHVGTGGNLTTDAHLAALAIEHGATVHSADHDFGRFPGVRWVDPLA